MEQTRLAENEEMARFLSRPNAFNEEDVNSRTRDVHRSSPVPGQSWHQPRQPDSGPEPTYGSRSMSRDEERRDVFQTSQSSPLLTAFKVEL